MRTEPADDGRARDSVLLRSDLIDLSDMSLADLQRLPPNVLSRSLHRILDESARQPSAYAQNFHSSI